MRKRQQTSPVSTLPTGARVLAPVFAASGGTGRSIVAGLTAQLLAPSNRTVLIDPQPRAVSPWPDWLAAPESSGLPGLVNRPSPPDQYEVAYAAVTRYVAAPGRGAAPTDVPSFAVLADTRAPHSRPVTAPSEPPWYAQLMNTGGWAAGVVDTSFPAYAEYIASLHDGRPSILGSWGERPDTIPIVVASWTGSGIAGMERIVDSLENAEVHPSKLVVVVSGTLAGEPPRSLRERVDRLAGRVGAAVHLPYDPVLQTSGLSHPLELSEPTLRAGHDIARAIIGVLGRTSTALAASFGASPMRLHAWTPNPSEPTLSDAPTADAAPHTSTPDPASTPPPASGPMGPPTGDGRSAPSAPSAPSGPAEPTYDGGAGGEPGTAPAGGADAVEQDPPTPRGFVPRIQPIEQGPHTPPGFGPEELTTAAFGVPPIPAPTGSPREPTSARNEPPAESADPTANPAAAPADPTVAPPNPTADPALAPTDAVVTPADPVAAPADPAGAEATAGAAEPTDPDTTSWFNPAALGDVDVPSLGVLGDPTFDADDDPTAPGSGSGGPGTTANQPASSASDPAAEATTAAEPPSGDGWVPGRGD